MTIQEFLKIQESVKTKKRVQKFCYCQWIPSQENPEKLVANWICTEIEVIS